MMTRIHPACQRTLAREERVATRSGPPAGRASLQRLRGRSGIRESNPHFWLGKPAYCHCTNPAGIVLGRWLVSLLAVACLIVLAPAAQGQAPGQTVRVTGVALVRGYTVVAGDGDLRIGVPPAAFTQPVTVTLTAASDTVPPLPPHVTATSARWAFQIAPTTAETAPAVPLRVQVAYDSASLRQRAVYFLAGGVWSKLKDSSDRPARQVATATVSALTGQLVVGEDDRTFVGLASWYRSRRYPYGAANNELPLNSRARVTNLATGQSVVVTIVSRGPFVSGRVIDLSLTAFSRVARPGAGLARVRVQSFAEATPMTPPGPPAVAGAAAAVYDPATDRFVWGKQEASAHPVASISKLVSALVIQSEPPEYRALVTMQPEDTPQPEPGVRIRVAPGQTVSVRDLFYAMITGSANNATLALARSTGLTTGQFVVRLNALAADHGWRTMHFDDPTGLAASNIASAADIARLGWLAFQDPLIRKAGARRTFRYTIQSTGERRTIKHPAFLYNAILDGSPILASKTGFINEAGHCIVLVAHGVSGKSFVVVVLGSPTTTTRSRDAKALIDWAAPQF